MFKKTAQSLPLSSGLKMRLEENCNESGVLYYFSYFRRFIILSSLGVDKTFHLAPCHVLSSVRHMYPWHTCGCRQDAILVLVVMDYSPLDGCGSLYMIVAGRSIIFNVWSPKPFFYANSWITFLKAAMETTEDHQALHSACTRSTMYMFAYELLTCPVDKSHYESSLIVLLLYARQLYRRTGSVWCPLTIGSWYCFLWSLDASCSQSELC